MQKFVPRSRIRIFHNERTRSTPYDPKVMFWFISYPLGAFATIRLPYETRGKTGRTSAKVRATKSRQNFSQRTHSIHFMDPKLLFWCISYHLGAFATIRLPYKTRGKTFLNKCKSSWHEDVSEFFATNAPDPPHWTLNSCFGEFRTI